MTADPIREAARAEVEANAGPATGEQAAQVQSTLGPGAAKNAQRRTKKDDDRETAA